MVTVPRVPVQITKTKFQSPTYHLEKGLTARVKNTKCLLEIDGTSKMLIFVRENTYENKMRQVK